MSESDKIKTISIPLVDQNSVEIIAKFPMTRQDFNLMLDLLKTMTPAIVFDPLINKGFEEWALN